MIKISKHNDITIVSFDNIDRITTLISEKIKDELKNIFQSNPRLVIDLKGIKYIDSTGFGIFLSLLKIANTNNGKFKICNVSPEVFSLFKLLQLHNIMEIYQDIDECVNTF